MKLDGFWTSLARWLRRAWRGWVVVSRHEVGRDKIRQANQGGTNSGQFHESMNIAAIWCLPLVVLIEAAVRRALGGTVSS